MISVRLHKHVDFGNVILLISDCHAVSWELGKAFEMVWHPGDIWCLSLPACCLPLTYRYVVVNQATRRIVEWEDGENRTISGHVQDYWGQTLVVVQVFSAKNYEPLFINIYTKGERTRYEMGKEALENQHYRFRYRAELLLPRQEVRSCGYKYSSLTMQERRNYRYFDSDRFMNNNRLQFFEDEELDLNLKIDKVRPNLYVGPYLYCEELSVLQEHGVDAVLNLQTTDDLVSKDLPSEYFDLIRREAESRNITYRHLPIRDSSKSAFIQRGFLAFQILRELLDEGKTVYVHCTVGIQRSVQTVILYLVFCEYLQLQEAIDEVKRVRSVANPFTDVLKKLVNQ